MNSQREARMTEISLDAPQEHIEYCEQIVEATEFETVEDYLCYIIEEIAINECRHENSPYSVSGDMSDQLESLGYL
jgi:hypothetical protein